MVLSWRFSAHRHSITVRQMGLEASTSPFTQAHSIYRYSTTCSVCSLQGALSYLYCKAITHACALLTQLG